MLGRGGEAATAVGISYLAIRLVPLDPGFSAHLLVPAERQLAGDLLVASLGQRSYLGCAPDQVQV